MALVNRQDVINKIIKGDIEVDLFSRDTNFLGVRFGNSGDDKKTLKEVKNGLSLEDLIDEIADSVIEDLDIVLTSGLEEVIRNVAFIKGKSSGKDYEMSDVLLDTLGFIEDSLEELEEKSDKAEVVIHDRNDGFSTVFITEWVNVEKIKEIVSFEKNTNTEWSIDTIEERVKKEIDNVVVKHNDHIRVINI